MLDTSKDKLGKVISISSFAKFKLYFAIFLLSAFVVFLLFKFYESRLAEFNITTKAIVSILVSIIIAQLFKPYASYLKIRNWLIFKIFSSIFIFIPWIGSNIYLKFFNNDYNKAGKLLVNAHPNETKNNKL